MESKPWDEKLEVLRGLLDEQLMLIDSQLQAVARAAGGDEGVAQALSEMKELCAFTRDLVSTLPRSRPGWPWQWKSRP